MNNLPREKQIEVIAALCEGVGVRTAARLTGVNRGTVGNLALRVGLGCMSRPAPTLAMGLPSLSYALGAMAMQDEQTYLRKLQRDAIDCALISKRATDPEKEQLFGRLAENLALLTAELERAIESHGGQCLMRSAAFPGP